MKQVLSVAVLLAVFAASPLLARDWSKVVDLLSKASFPLQTANGDIYCTGFMIDSTREYALTASHCVENEDGSVAEVVFAGRALAKVLRNDPDLDVALLEVIGTLTRPAIKISTKTLKAGMEMGSYGYARESGLYSHFRAGNLAAVGQAIDGLSGIWVVTDQAFIGGMSGGPVVDSDGKLIAMVQRSDRALTGIGRSAKSIWLATQKFWGPQ